MGSAGGVDGDSLARRRDVVQLPMVPLRRVTPVGPPGALPGSGWSFDAVGIGPDGYPLWAFSSHEEAGKTLVRGTGPGTLLLDGAVRAEFVQPLPRGGALLVGWRGTSTTVAQAWDADGRLVASADVGDGIHQVLTTPSGRIWVAYSEEADGWLGSPLVRLGAGLESEWRYPSHRAERGVPCVADIHALNAWQEEVFFCADDDRLVHVTKDRVVDHGPLEAPGASGLVLDSGRGALVGGYGPDHDVIRPLTVGAHGLEGASPVGRLVMPDGLDLHGVSLVSRGPSLHAVARHGARYTVDLKDLLNTAA